MGVGPTLFDTALVMVEDVDVAADVKAFLFVIFLFWWLVLLPVLLLFLLLVLVLEPLRLFV